MTDIEALKALANEWPRGSCWVNASDIRALIDEIEQLKDFRKVTRVEVVDYRRDAADPGRRTFSAWDVRAEVYIQDDGRTLKVFVNDQGEE